jgi:hypothetical protein
MAIEIGSVVMLPGYAPYPRYGRVTKLEGPDLVHVTDLRCGDPRCTAEHRHGDQVWRREDLLGALAYQPRAQWELGRRSSPNTPLD